MKLLRIGVDLAKNVFQVHDMDRFEKPVWRKKLGRQEWLTAVLERIEPDCEIGMDACSGAHRWARQLQKRGYTVKLMPRSSSSPTSRATRMMPMMPRPFVKP